MLSLRENEWRFPPSSRLSLPHTLSENHFTLLATGHVVRAQQDIRCLQTSRGATNAQTSVCACNLSGCMRPKWVMAAPTGYSVTISCLHPAILCRAVRRSAGCQSEIPSIVPNAQTSPLSNPLPPCPPDLPAVTPSSPLRPQGGSASKPLNRACFFSRRAPPLLCSIPEAVVVAIATTVTGVKRHRKSGCSGMDYGVKTQGPRGVCAGAYVSCQ